MALSTRETPRQTVGAARARQGRSGRHVLWVLLFGTVLAALAMFAALAWHSDEMASTEPNNAKEQADAQAFNAPEPAAINPQPYQKETPPEGNHTAPGPHP